MIAAAIAVGVAQADSPTEIEEAAVFDVATAKAMLESLA